MKKGEMSLIVGRTGGTPQFALREAAFEAWCIETFGVSLRDEDRQVSKQAFDAGWLARKKSVDYAVAKRQAS